MCGDREELVPVYSVAVIPKPWLILLRANR